MKNVLTFSGVLLLLLITSCNCPECFTPPESVALRIVDKTDTTDLIFTNRYNADSIAVFYVENSNRKDVEIEIITDSIKKQSVILSHEMGWVSAGGIKEYFLYLNYFDTDTIYLDYEERSDRCCTFYHCNLFTINSTDIERDMSDYLYYYFK